MINSGIILGKGYVGKALFKSLPKFETTSRRKNNEDIYFNFEDKSTWKNLPQKNIVIITFFLQNKNLIEDFFNFYLKKCKKIFLYSTTSIYLAKEGNIDETSVLDTQHKRYEIEFYLASKGVNILTLSGICGENRQPKEWLINGKIINGLKRVNLIHCDDIVMVTVHLLNCEFFNKRINLTSGGYIWQDIANELKLNIKFSENLVNNRIISNKKLVGLLPKNYKFICPYK